jgi:hypothetical protein
LAETLDAPVCVGYQQRRVPGQPPAVCWPIGLQRIEGRHGIDLHDVVSRLAHGSTRSLLAGYGIDYWANRGQKSFVDINPTASAIPKVPLIGIRRRQRQSRNRDLGKLTDTASVRKNARQ